MAKKKAKKKTAKKTTKKAPKKAAKKVAKKSAKKTDKKAAKKTAPKKAAKNTAKPTAKKAAAPKVTKAAAPKAAAPKAAAPKKLSTPTTTTHPLLGATLPSLTLHKQDGSELPLTTLNQGKVVLYFYPKDDTPGCTTEACGFRDNFNRAQTHGVRVIGVSPDTIESHQKFIEKYGLNFELLADADHKLADELKVWKEKNFMGKTYMGIERSTFLLNNGKIVKAWQPVKVDGHVDEVLAAAETLS